MVTNRGARMFSGYWEYPIITMPNGKEIELLHNVAEMAEGSISDNGISGNQLVINLTASGKYGSNSKNLTSSITLVKVNDGGGEGGDDEDFQTGSYAKNQIVEGSVIKWTLVRTFNKKADTETPMSFNHLYGMTVDVRKSTEDRTYNAGTPSLVETSRISSTEGNYSFDFCKYTSTWSYSDFSHAANAEGRRNIVYHDGNFDVEVWDAALSIERNGVTLGTSNISSSSDKETYIDLINYVLFAGNASVSTGSQEVAYTKNIETKPDDPTEEDVVTYNVEKVGVRGNKLYFNYIEKHSVNTELNKVTEGAEDLVYSFAVAACGDWSVMEGEATGLTLNASSFNYTTAKNYIFGSNRGDNVATANLQTSYPVSYMGKTYTLTIAGTVTGEVNMTASTATNSNTYVFTGKLLADGVEIASDSDSAIETVEKKEEPEEPVEKDYIEATSFDCTVGVTDSGYAGIVIVAHYADGTHVASNGATSTTWGNTLVNGNIGTLETIGNVYSWNGGYIAILMHEFIYQGADSPYVGCTPTDNGDGTYTVTSNRGGVTYTFPKRAK